MKNNSTNNENLQPILLAIETSGEVCSVALSRGKTLLSEIRLFRRNIHSRELSPAINSLMQLSDEKLNNLDAIVLSSGPGSFTGLRIGYSVAKGLSFALGTKIIEVPTLDLLAMQAPPGELPVIAVMDARRGELYAANYQRLEDSVKRTSDYRIIKPRQLMDSQSGPCRVIGTNHAGIREVLKTMMHPQSELMVDADRVPLPGDLLHLGAQRFVQNNFANTEDCEPMYLRPFQGVA